MATIQAIEAKSVHQIQSGQVIVDLCSVVKELIENSLDASATSIEVRFKNNGLDSIEVQDNGSGIASSNYANVALKHHTSKLSTFDDLSELHTFGFRGEALSSLCALSSFSIITAQVDEAPKGQKLEFELSGALKSTSTVASPKGTTAIVEGLFEKLPVRRKELSKNIKREYGKVLGQLHAYACIGTNVKFTVRNAMPKAKSTVVFSTRGNATTKENIANVYGTKTLTGLIPLDLKIEYQPTLTQMARDDAHMKTVHIQGHISKPTFGEGRQVPDRQMFFVNGRPCGLPQIAKAINEVYKSFNISQSPFIFADFRMDTNAYDVNVSPDKRSIMMHDAATLIDQVKTHLNAMFDQHDQTVPQSQVQTPKLPAFRPLNVTRPTLHSPALNGSRLTDDSSAVDEADLAETNASNSIFHDHFRAQASTREEPYDETSETESKQRKSREKRAEKIAQAIARKERLSEANDGQHKVEQKRSPSPVSDSGASATETPHDIRVRDFNARMAEQRNHVEDTANEPLQRPAEENTADQDLKDEAGSPGVVQRAFDRMRPTKARAQIAEITIGDETTTTVVGSQLPVFRQTAIRNPQADRSANLVKNFPASQFSQRLQKFEAGSASDARGSVPEDTTPDPVSSTDSDGVDKSAEQSGSDVKEESQESGNSSDDSDPEYIDEDEKKAAEEARVAELIRVAEENAMIPSKENTQRANKLLKGGKIQHSTTNLLTSVEMSLETLVKQTESLKTMSDPLTLHGHNPTTSDAAPDTVEEQLSLTVSKNDFAGMQIVGQFNLGFIITVRSSASLSDNPVQSKDELFIIDQHASDEKYNFERLQAETTVGNQRMVRPVLLNLTAVEEEVVLDNTAALEQNGFIVDVDTTGDQPVGRRCTLISLPLSKEVVFDARDLEELIHLLSESPTLESSTSVPRPSRVRKMFAMRACRSSIMIGKTLSKKQMRSVVSHMGTIDKPWNCPHGRPTMRHLTSLDALISWQEGDGVMMDSQEPEQRRTQNVWSSYLGL